ncbi:helix-turn-helix protein [compost metagenome]
MSSVMSIPAELARARKQAGLTQQDLARRARVSRMTVQRLEAGQLEPRFVTVHELAHVLGLEMVLLPRHLQGKFEEFLRACCEPGAAGAQTAPPSIVDVLAAASGKP